MQQTDIHVPLLFRGPGIPAGAVLPQMSGNIDIMPTIIDLAAGLAAIPPVVDGKSLLPVLVPAVATQRGWKAEQWRDYFLVEYLSVGTPLDTAFYLNKSHGESYGLKMTPGKARANVEWLAPEIAGMPEGLFFTGQACPSFHRTGSMIHVTVFK